MKSCVLFRKNLGLGFPLFTMVVVLPLGKGGPVAKNVVPMPVLNRESCTVGLQSYPRPSGLPCSCRVASGGLHSCIVGLAWLAISSHVRSRDRSVQICHKRLNAPVSGTL